MGQTRPGWHVLPPRRARQAPPAKPVPVAPASERAPSGHGHALRTAALASAGGRMSRWRVFPAHPAGVAPAAPAAGRQPRRAPVRLDRQPPVRQASPAAGRNSRLSPSPGARRPYVPRPAARTPSTRPGRRAPGWPLRSGQPAGIVFSCGSSILPADAGVTRLESPSERPSRQPAPDAPAARREKRDMAAGLSNACSVLDFPSQALSRPRPVVNGFVSRGAPRRRAVRSGMPPA